MEIILGLKVVMKMKKRQTKNLFRIENSLCVGVKIIIENVELLEEQNM